MTVEVHVVLPEPTYDLFQRLAQERHQDVAEAIADYLAQNPPSLAEESIKIATAELIDPEIAREKQAYLQMHKRLWTQYPGQYVAIKNGQLVDHDIDKLALYTRIEQQYSEQFVLVRRVEATPERIITFHSVRSIERQL